jgi:hypothetical protein
VAGRGNLWIGFPYQAILANDERAAQQSCNLLAIALLLAPCTVSFDRLAVGVRKKRKL